MVIPIHFIEFVPLEVDCSVTAWVFSEIYDVEINVESSPLPARQFLFDSSDRLFEALHKSV